MVPLSLVEFRKHVLRYLRSLCGPMFCLLKAEHKHLAKHQVVGEQVTQRLHEAVRASSTLSGILQYGCHPANLQDHNHTTEQYKSLHYLVEKLIKIGLLKQYVCTIGEQRDMTQEVAVQAPTSLVAPRVVINYIHGGPVDDIHSSKCQRKRLLCAASIRERVNSVQHNFTEGSVRPIDDIVTFPLVDSNRVLQPHEDALVLTLGVTLEVGHSADDEMHPKSSRSREQYQSLSQTKKEPSVADLLQPLRLSHDTDQITYTSSLLTQEELELLESMLKRNKDVFTWTHSDMPRIHPFVASHKLNILPTSRPIQQKRAMVDTSCRQSVRSVPDPGVSLILQSLIGELMKQAICLNFSTSNNVVEYEVILTELDLTLTLVTTKLEIRSDFQLIIIQIQREYETKDECMARYLAMCLNEPEAKYVLAELHEGVCDNHPSERTLAHRAYTQGYYWPTMKQDAESYVKRCDWCQRHAPIPCVPVEALNLFTITQKKYFLFATDYFSKWMEVEAYASIKDKDVPKFVWKNIVDELPKVLWAYRTTSRRPIGATSFAFDYGMEVIIPTEIGMPIVKIAVQDQKNNDEELIRQLDWADKMWGDVTIRMTSYHQRTITQYSKKA
uniref:Integrase zinc-binding domain-containing protein n=1 Tax=Vitis vinifera TaxID=29760 RepID=A5BW50_VITVI|nr:hypothetical protein VITISV_018658 [Vitis vinifera]